MTRCVTVLEGFRFWEQSNETMNKEKRADFVTRFIWTAASVVGSVVYFASFGAFALPFFNPANTWFSATLIFCVLQYASWCLTHINYYWGVATSRLWLLWNLMRGKSIAKLREDARVQRPDHFA